MKNNTHIAIFLVILSAIFYAGPLIWLDKVNLATSCISSFVALITIVIYAFYIKQHSIKEIGYDTLIKMIISGICYGLGLLCYVEAVKYNQPSLLNLQTIFIFLLSTIIAFMILEEKTNICKLLGIITIFCGSILLIYGS